MKVIARVDHDTVLCEVRHTEVEKFKGLYYGNMKKMEIGDDIDLGAGHDFLSETKTALKKTEEFIESNAEVLKAITKGINVFSNAVEKNDSE